MSRTLTSGVSTESQAEVIRPVYLVDLDFTTPVNVNSSPYSITWNSKTYAGVGNLGAIDPIEETTELAAKGVKLTLSGIPSSLISTALSEDYQGKDANIWLGFLNSSHALIADPVLIGGNYRIDTMNISMGETATIVLTAESHLADLRRPRVSRYTDAEQKERYPGDLGLEFIDQVPSKDIIWKVGL